jgi:CSLREA domain-containing protein
MANDKTDHPRRPRRLRLPTRTVGLLAVAALGAGVLVACELPVTRTFVVTTVADDTDADPGDGSCATVGGACSLRAAVMESNASGSSLANVIVLEAGATYTVGHLSGDPESEATEDLDTWVPTRIEGNGAVLSGGTSNRVIEHHEGHLELDDLTIRDGSADVGGGILNRSRLTLRTVRLIENRSTGPGGTALHQESGDTDLDRVTIEANPSEAAAGTVAGAIYVAAGGFVLTSSTVAENFAVRCDGGEIPMGFWCQDVAGPLQTPSARNPTAGVVNGGGTVVIVSSTISNHQGNIVTVNCVTFPRPGCLGSLQASISGDGVVALGGETVIVRTTMLGNRVAIAASAPVTISGSVIATCTGTITSGGYNLDANGSCVDGSTSTDAAAGALWISATLDDNGGPTRTHLPYFAPVRDAIPLGTPLLCDGSLPTDQRGLPQAAGGACDRGSVDV